MAAESAALQELLDKKACEEVLARYACALEWADEGALKTVFFADAEIDYGYFQGRGDEFIPIMMGFIRSYLRTWHNNGAPLLRIHGDVAEAETHGTGATVSEQDGKLITNLLGGRYLDRLERRDGQWGIARRSYIVDWTRSFESDTEAEAALGMNRIENPDPNHPQYRNL